MHVGASCFMFNAAPSHAAAAAAAASIPWRAIGELIKRTSQRHGARSPTGFRNVLQLLASPSIAVLITEGWYTPRVPRNSWPILARSLPGADQPLARSLVRSRPRARRHAGEIGHGSRTAPLSASRTSKIWFVWFSVENQSPSSIVRTPASSPCAALRKIARIECQKMAKQRRTTESKYGPVTTAVIDNDDSCNDIAASITSRLFSALVVPVGRIVMRTFFLKKRCMRLREPLRTCASLSVCLSVRLSR